MKNRKKIAIIIFVCLILLVLIFIVFKIYNINKDSKYLRKNLAHYGEKYYIDNYYSKVTNTEFLAKFKDTGLNINAYNLDLIIKLDDDVKKILNKYKCNLEETGVLIYPIEPYSVNDYRIETKISCSKLKKTF